MWTLYPCAVHRELYELVRVRVLCVQEVPFVPDPDSDTFTRASSGGSEDIPDCYPGTAQVSCLIHALHTSRFGLPRSQCAARERSFDAIADSTFTGGPDCLARGPCELYDTGHYSLFHSRRPGQVEAVYVSAST